MSTSAVRSTVVPREVAVGLVVLFVFSCAFLVRALAAYDFVSIWGVLGAVARTLTKAVRTVLGEGAVALLAAGALVAALAAALLAAAGRTKAHNGRPGGLVDTAATGLGFSAVALQCLALAAVLSPGEYTEGELFAFKVLAAAMCVLGGIITAVIAAAGGVPILKCIRSPAVWLTYASCALWAFSGGGAVVPEVAKVLQLMSPFTLVCCAFYFFMRHMD